MKPWKDLSMKERGAFIRVGVKNGITSVDGIRDAYNKFACGGHKFDGTSEPTQRLYQNSQGNLLSQDQYDELVWRAKNNADIAAVNDYREVRVPIRQQQPVDDRMFEGNLNEITVRPDIAYNSDVRNIPALETTEEPISDEWRKRFARSNAQLRRQAKGYDYPTQEIYQTFLSKEREDRKKDKLRVAVYNNVYPYGYDIVTKNIPGIIKDYIKPKGISYDIMDKNRYYFGISEFPAAQVSPIKEAFRKEAFRIAMGIPDKYTENPDLYTLNNDGTYSINRDAYERIMSNNGCLGSYDMPVIHEAGRHKGSKAFKDNFVFNHGTVKVVKDDDKYTMEDDWTLRPFRDNYCLFRLPKRLRNTDLVDWMGGNPFVLRQDISDMNKDSLESWTNAGYMSKYHIKPSNYRKKQDARKERQWFLRKYNQQHDKYGSGRYINNYGLGGHIYDKGGRLAHKFDGTSEPTQWMFRNKSNPNDLISEAQYEKLFNTGDERFKNYEGVRVAIPRQAMPRQQEVDHLYKDGRLDEITVRPDIAYNSDVRNIPALETTEEPLSDEIRKRFANSVGQQRRQAQMTPAEQWANYYNNLANLSYEDRLALENDKKFKRFIGGVAGGLITAPVTIPAIAGSIAYAPEAYSWLMQKGLPAATKFMSTKLNPGWWADQATLGARQLAQKYGLSALESGLSALTGEVGLSGMAGGFSGFGSSTIPGMALNAYLGAEMGYNAFNNLINKPFSSPDRTWKDNAWDALGLTGGIATGLETGISTMPALNQLYGRAMIGADTFRDYFTGRKNIDEIINIINREFTSANKLYDTGFLPKVTKFDKKAMSKKPVTFRKFLENLYGKEKGRILYRALRKADSSKMNQLEKQYAQAIDYSITNRLRQNLHEWAMGSTDDLNIPEVMEDAGAFDTQAYQSWLNSSIGKRQVARLNRAIAKLNPNYEKVLKQQYGYVSPISYKTALAKAFNKNTRMYERFARGSKRAIASSQLKYLERLGELDRAIQLQQNIRLSPMYPSSLHPIFLLGNTYYTLAQGPKDTVINLGKAKNKDIKKFYERFLKEHDIKDVRISISPEGDVVAESTTPTIYSIVDENRLSGNMPIWDWENKGEAALLPYNITVEGANDQTVNNIIRQVLDLKKRVLTDNGASSIVEYGSLNVPTIAKRNLEKFVQGVIDLLGVPGHPEYNAQLMGSLSLFLENGLASAPGDMDLITTTTRINNCPTLRNALAGVPYDKKGYTRNITVGMNGSSTGIAKGDHDSSSAFGKMGVLDINEIKTDADDNILTGIDPNTGRHVNELAVELYRQFFPEDFNRELQNAWLSRPKAEWFNSVNPEFPIQFTHLDPETGQIVPLKGEDLMNAYNPVTKAVIDALEIDFKSPNKEKHKNRIFQFMQWGPAEYVSRGIRAFAQSRLGSHYNPPINLAEAGLFNNTEANKQMLAAMGYHFGTPLDPQRMQNAFELWYLDATLKYRGISPQRFKKPGALDNPENFMANLLSSVNEWFYGQPTGTYEGNGYSNGVGLNSASSQTQYGDIGMFVQLPVNFNGVTSPSDAVTAVQRATGTNYRFTEEDLKNMPITSALIKPGDTSKQLLKSATNHFGEIRNKNGGKTLEAGKWFEEWQRELKDNGIYGLTDPIGSYTQNNAYTSLTNNVVDNNIQAALKTNVNQGLSRDLPQRNTINTQSTSLSYMKNHAFKDTGNALLGLRDSNIDYSREWEQLTLPTVRKKYGMDMVNAVKEYYNSDLYKESGKLDGEAIVPGIRSVNQLIMEGEESTPLYDKIINEYGEDKGKKMIHLINVNELMRLIEYIQNPTNSPYITSSKITVRTLERGQGLLHSNIGDRRKFDRGMTDYDLLVDAGYSPDEIEEAVELHNEKVNNNDRIVTTTEYRGKKYRNNVSKVEDEISISKDNVRRAKEQIIESQKDYRGYLEKVRRTSPNQDDETAAKDIMKQRIKSRNDRIESMLTHKWDSFMGDLWDMVKNKKSYGGSLNLNDQYGIGKYINY